MESRNFSKLNIHLSAHKQSNKIDYEILEERFYVYVRFGWKIFKVTAQEIISSALDKNTAKATCSNVTGDAIDTTISAAGIIAGTRYIILVILYKKVIL